LKTLFNKKKRSVSNISYRSCSDTSGDFNEVSTKWNTTCFIGLLSQALNHGYQQWRTSIKGLSFVPRRET